MLPVLHIDEEALRPRIERAKLRARRSFSLEPPHDDERSDGAIVARLVRSHSSVHAEVSSRLGMRRERCASCGEPVFLAEKLVVARGVYHRSCFRCARCRHQLTPGNYYETEDGQYCCEACPIDEPEQPTSRGTVDLDAEPQQHPPLTSQREPPDQQQQPPPPVPSHEEAAVLLLEAPLSDEEKSKQLEQHQQQQPQPQEPDDRLDQMLKLINDRIDQLTSSDEPQQPALGPSACGSPSSSAPPSPDATRARRSPVHSAPDSPSAQPSSQQHSTSLQRSSSLSLVSEHTKEQRQPPPRRRLSLGQQPHRGRRLFEQPRPSAPAEQPQPRAQQQQPGDYPADLNPFASDAEDEADRRPSEPVSGNPFGSDEDDEELPPVPMARTKSKRRVLEAPQINLNPFWSDEEEAAGQCSPQQPVPRPRSTLRHSHATLARSSLHSSNASIASSCSTLTPGGTYRKKKPAPPPPSSLDTSATSPRLTPRTRKVKPAPPPPPTPSCQPAPPAADADARLSGEQQTTTTTTRQADNDKLSKDEANRNTRSLSSTESSLLYPGQLDKSLEGKWKRKKGPAPPRPMPLRRKIKVMSMKDVKLELDQIEMQQQGLERQGVRLEQIIRDKCETGTASEETSLGIDVEELVLELFALVNEKNELFRRQAELMLLRRQQRLEEEHADIEYQVRCLITQPEATKTDFDKQREETLIQRLVEIVEKRNEIVECLEMDRRRETEEDRSIHREMDLYAARNKAENVNVTDESRRSTLKLKKGKAKEKVKEKKSKKSSKKDADKDVDETEAKLKRHTLRKWF